MYNFLLELVAFNAVHSLVMAVLNEKMKQRVSFCFSEKKYALIVCLKYFVQTTVYIMKLRMRIKTIKNIFLCNSWNFMDRIGNRCTRKFQKICFPLITVEMAQLY